MTYGTREEGAGVTPRTPRRSRPVMLQRVRLDSAESATIARRGLLSTLGVLFQGLARFVTNLLVGRIGGPTVLGAVATTLSTAQLLSLLWPTSTGNAASKFIAQARGRGDPAEASAVAAHLARRTLQAGSALSLLSVPIWTQIEHGSLREACVVVALVIGYSGYSFTRGLQYGAGQVARATWWDVTASAFGLLGVGVALLAGVRGTAVILPLAAAYILFTLASWPWCAQGRPAATLRREVDSFVALGVVGTLASAGFLQLSLIVARLSDGLAAAGQYAAALALATPPSVLVISFSQVLFPAMAESWGRGDVERVRRQTDQATRVLVVAMPLVFGALALCSPLIVRIIWGERYDRAATVLPVLLLAILANTIGTACTITLTSKSHRGMVTSTAASLVGMATGVLFWAILAPRWGVLGVAIGYLCGTTVISAIPLIIVWRADRHRWGGLTIRLAVGITVLAALLLGEHSLEPTIWLEPPIALAFVALWLGLMRNDARTALTLLNRQRRRGTPQSQPTS